MVLLGLAIAVAAIWRRVQSKIDARRTHTWWQASIPLAPNTADGAIVVANGYVELADDAIEAPLTGRSCVAFRAEVKLGGLWGPASRPRARVASVRFTIRCADGTRIAIESEHLHFDLPYARVTPDERCTELAKSMAIASGDRAGAAYREVAIVEGMLVAVSGRLEREPVLRLVGTADRPIAIGRPLPAA